MSVYLKPGQLKIKDENGDYTGINTVALESTAEYLEEMETKGDQIMDDIETKGEETLESIPEDYTALSEAVDELNERLSDELPNWDRLEGVEILKGNLYPSAVDSGDGAYYYDGSAIQHADYTNYKWFKIPVKSNSVYYTQYPARFWYSLDTNGTVVSYGTNAGDNGGTLGVGENAVFLVISYNFVLYPAFAIAEAYYAPSDYETKFKIPETVFINDENILGMEKAEGQSLSHNVFSEAILMGIGYYADILNGKLRLIQASTYNTYIMPVNGGVYEMDTVRTAVLTLEDKITAVGNIYTYATAINTIGAKYLVFSIDQASYPNNSFVIRKPVDNYYIPTNWIVSDNNWKTPIAKVSSPFNAGGGIEIPFRSAIKDGQKIVFKGFFSEFDSITLRFCTSAVQYYTNTITVTGTNITTVHGRNQTDTKQHGLTIANDISLTVEFINGKAKITLYSNGHSFSVEYTWYQTSATTTYPAVISSGSTFTSAELTIVYQCALRDIWIFGDSYITFNDIDRYPYYIVEDGYGKNVLFSGAGGGNSLTATMALNTLLKYGTPKIAVFATGMNDGNDTSSSEPSEQWVTYKNEFISTCERYGITPILCTVPTVPIVNNEGKNAWVRSSGYRYIDFAKAVGANENGVWYSGMLSGDNVHPSEYGAKALYTQLLADLPEIMLPN